ncbi:MAG TPA: phytanoyl-CoA dioxygenase family protein [Thermoanaerobaculia bacterium]|nr:phytanoyl-CoA dioxygenase family protein [Thermoanaerobaculia bacterium]
MKLTQEQLASYERDGYLFLPELFSPREVEVLNRQLPELFSEDSERRVVEKGSGVVRSVYGSHSTNEVFRRLTCHPRLAEPAMQILGSQVYVYQFKINAKVAFLGDVWEWHQDYIFWQREDGVPAPELVTLSIFLDEVTEFNGPLLLVPGSHHEGVIEPPRTGGVPQGYEGSPDWIANLTADLKYSVNKDNLSRLVDRGGIVAPKGPAGSALFFHPNLVHGSVPNLSPYDRRIVLVTYNRVDNLPSFREKQRPEFLVSRDFKPISPLADNALVL